MFTLLGKNLESMEKEESIAIDYLATDNNWHLSRFIVQSRTEDGTAREVPLVIRVISEEKRREKYLIDDVPFHQGAGSIRDNRGNSVLQTQAIQNHKNASDRRR